MNLDLVQAPSSVHYLLLKLHMATETHDLPEDEAEARRRAVHAEGLGWKYMRVCGCIQTPGSEVQAHKLLPQVSLRVPPAWLGLVLVSVSSLPFSLVLLSAPTKYSGFAWPCSEKSLLRPDCLRARHPSNLGSHCGPTIS